MIFYACPSPSCSRVLPVGVEQALGAIPITCPCGRTRRASSRDILRSVVYRR